jgi:hypothetical protein
MTSDKEGRLILPSPRRHDMGPLPAPATTMSWLENTPTTQAMTTIPMWPAVSQLDINLPFKRLRAHQEGKRAQAHAQPPCVK